jgi:small conductance mechanosensitive channel
VIPNSQITTVANQSVDFSVATINVSVDFSANPDKVMELLTRIATDIRTSKEYRDLFVADPQVLGVDSMRGSQLIFPVVFKTRATQQYGPVREFQRRVRIALEENHMLPGDPNRVFNSFFDRVGGPHSAAPMMATELGAEPARDPTTIKPQETNPFSVESS